MEYKKFKFDPEDGFLDGNFYEDTPSDPREILQRQHNQTRDFINGIVDTLNSKTEGTSGSESVKSPDIAGVSGDNVYEQLKDIKRQINESAEAKIPDASVGEEKIKNEAITKAKIKDKEITSEKFKEDAVCPYANEPLHINGKESSYYVPIGNTASLFMFKELVTEEKFSQTYGKNYNGKRYFVKDGYFYTLDLKTGEINKYSETQVGNPDAFAVYSEDVIYYIIFTNLYNKTHLNLYKCETQYEDSILINSFEFHDTSKSSFNFIGMDICGEDMIIAKGSVGGGKDYNNVYKVSLNELDNKDNFFIYHSFENSYNNANVISCNNDFIVGNMLFKNGDKDQTREIYANVKSYDGKDLILTVDLNLPIADINTFNPRCAVMPVNLYNSFLYDGFLYAYIEKYLFKTRIF